VLTEPVKLLAKNLVRAFGNRERLEYAALLIEFEAWRDKHRPARLQQWRKQLYQDVHEEHLAKQPVDYLEFGVYQGDTIRYWSEIATAPSSRFFGFDSFEGLPEDWGQYPKGHFSVGGAIPQIADPRVSFVRGWFHETLPPFLQGHQPRNRLVVYLDADLYSSTLFVLATLDRFLVPGAVLIFDEFNDFRHEFRALRDYADSFRRHYRVLYCTQTYKQVALVLD
jgi:hypothetical protein